MTYFKKNKAKRPAVRSLPPGPWTQARADEAQRREAFPSWAGAAASLRPEKPNFSRLQSCLLLRSTTRSPPRGAQTSLPSCHLLWTKCSPSPAGAAFPHLLLERHLPQSQVRKDRAGGSGPAGKARGPACNALRAQPGPGGWQPRPDPSGQPREAIRRLTAAWHLPRPCLSPHALSTIQGCLQWGLSWDLQHETT